MTLEILVGGSPVPRGTGITLERDNRILFENEKRRISPLEAGRGGKVGDNGLVRFSNVRSGPWRVLTRSFGEHWLGPKNWIHVIGKSDYTATLKYVRNRRIRFKIVDERNQPVPGVVLFLEIAKGFSSSYEIDYDWSITSSKDGVVQTALPHSRLTRILRLGKYDWEHRKFEKKCDFSLDDGHYLWDAIADGVLQIKRKP